MAKGLDWSAPDVPAQPAGLDWGVKGQKPGLNWGPVKAVGQYLLKAGKQVGQDLSAFGQYVPGVNEALQPGMFGSGSDPAQEAAARMGITPQQAQQAAGAGAGLVSSLAAAPLVGGAMAGPASQIISGPLGQFLGRAVGGVGAGMAAQGVGAVAAGRVPTTQDAVTGAGWGALTSMLHLPFVRAAVQDLSTPGARALATGTSGIEPAPSITPTLPFNPTDKLATGYAQQWKGLNATDKASFLKRLQDQVQTGEPDEALAAKRALDLINPPQRPQYRSMSGETAQVQSTVVAGRKTTTGTPYEANVAGQVPLSESAIGAPKLLRPNAVMQMNISGANAGFGSSEDRLAFASRMVGRPLTDFSHLTKDEAGTVMAAFEQRRMQLRLPQPVSTTDPLTAMETAKITVGSQLATAGLADDMPLFQQVWRNYITSGQSALEKMGPAGAALASRIEAAGNNAMIRSGPAVFELQGALKKMNEQQARHFFNVIDGLDGAETPLEQKAQQLWATTRGEIAAEAQKVKLRVWDYTAGDWRPFVPRDNYAPHVFTEESINRLEPAAREELLNTMISRRIGGALNRAQALKVLTRYGDAAGAPEMLQKNLQISRVSDLPGYETDARKVLSNYVINAWNRIENAREFGADHAGAELLVKQIGKEAGAPNAELANKLYSSYVGWRPYATSPLGQMAANASKAYRSVAVIDLLSPNAALKHLSQLNNTFAVAGVTPTVRAVFGLMTKEGREFAQRAGATMRATIPEISDQNLSGLAKKTTDWIGLRGMVNANRMVAAVAGKFQAQDLAAQFMEQRTPQLGRQLLKLGIDPDAVISQGGKLSDAQLRMAGINMLNRTQLMGRVLDLPYGKNTVAGQYLYLFRSSAIQQTKVFNREVFKPLVDYVRSGGQQGSYGPFIRWTAMTGTASAGTGALIEELRSIRSGKPVDSKKMSGLVRYAQGVGNSGTLGYTAEALDAILSRDPDRVRDTLLGPAISDVGEAGQTAGNVLTGHFREAAAQTATRLTPASLQMLYTPLMGHTLQATIAPPKPKAPTLHW